MTDKIISEIRASGESLKRAIIREVTVERSSKIVTVKLIADSAFTPADKTRAIAAIKKFVPEYFELNVEISKLTPDCEMVKRKINEAISIFSKPVFATLTQDDVVVNKTENGFNYGIYTVQSLSSADLCDRVTDYLQKSFCGEFSGKIECSKQNLDDIEVEQEYDEPEFEMPVRFFEIIDFEFIEGDKIQKNAVYLSDLNFAGDEAVVCGVVEDVRERSYKNKKDEEKVYFTYTLNDGTATSYITYFPRLKTIEKIRQIKVGESIVCTGTNEEFRGNRRFTAKVLDYGKAPAGFVPEKRKSKPVPRYYKTVKPEPYVDLEQADFFTEKAAPKCLSGHKFVVFDLETTGLNSSPVSGNMDRIIEIGAFKIENGEISESFTTFINPQRKLSEEITALTGINEDMVKDAPVYEDVMGDFFKFCDGCILVGHNVAGFDFKFVDYYCASLGYVLERKIIDTIPLAQELLFLPNYKLNTVADKFGITFNHHRAIDDALTTAKIFIELIRLKKSLPKF